MTATTDTPFHLVEPFLEEFEVRWSESLTSDIRLIHSVEEYLKMSRGKRFRPGLVFLSAGMFDIDQDKLFATAQVVELIHIATLLHDDVIDNSFMRRGLPSVFRKWDKRTAILMGDYLFTLAFDIMVRSGLDLMLRILADASLKLAKGEILDVETEGCPDLKREEYRRVIDLKTASLISSCCAAGPALSGALGETVEMYSSVGNSLGHLYQMVDDILDYSGEADQIGKPLNQDLQSRKVTLPYICAYENAGADDRKKLENLLVNGRVNTGVDGLYWLVRELKGIAMAERDVSELSERIKSDLNRDFPNEAAADFSRVVDYLVSRRR